jgi:hypothetical protein
MGNAAFHEQIRGIGWGGPWESEEWQCLCLWSMNTWV